MNGDPFETLSFFANFTSEQLDVLRAVFVPCDVYVDTLIFEQDAPAEFLYIVVKGEILVSFKPDDGPRLTVARVQMGGVVGWSAALGSRKYTSAAISTEYTQLLRVRGSDLRHVFRQYPDIALIIKNRLADVIAERTRITHAQVVSLLDLGLSPSDLSKEYKQ